MFIFTKISERQANDLTKFITSQISAKLVDISLAKITKTTTN